MHVHSKATIPRAASRKAWPASSATPSRRCSGLRSALARLSWCNRWRRSCWRLLCRCLGSLCSCSECPQACSCNGLCLAVCLAGFGLVHQLVARLVRILSPLLQILGRHHSEQPIEQAPQRGGLLLRYQQPRRIGVVFVVLHRFAFPFFQHPPRWRDGSRWPVGSWSLLPGPRGWSSGRVRCFFLHAWRHRAPENGCVPVTTSQTEREYVHRHL